MINSQNVFVDFVIFKKTKVETGVPFALDWDGCQKTAPSPRTLTTDPILSNREI